MSAYNTYSGNAALFGENSVGMNYLVTEEIPNFNFDGSSPFSVIISFGFYSNDREALLYGKKGYFEIGFKEENFYLSTMGATYLTPIVNFGFKSEQWYDLAVTFDLEKIMIYVNGLWCLTFTVEVPQIIDVPEDVYTIGYNWDGFIKSIAVESKCLMSDELLYLYRNITDSIDEAVAWFDFTGNGIVDKSSNEIPINQAESSTIVISNNCMIADFSKLGYMKGNSSLGDNMGYSLLCKVYLNSHYEDNQYTLFSNTFEKSRIKLSFKKASSSSSTFLLVCSLMNDAQENHYSSDTIIYSKGWVDIGVSYANSLLSIYINGVLDTSIGDLPVGMFSGEGSVYIGAPIDEGGIASDCFNGYVSYVCEFSKVLEASKFLEYKDNPPYLFSPSIASLFLFSTTVAQELVQGKEYKFEQGARWSWVIDTQPTTVPNETIVELNLEDYKVWDEYTDSQKWNIETYASVLSQYIISTGVVAELDADWYKNSAIADLLYKFTETDPAFSAFLAAGPNVEDDDVEVLLGNSLIILMEVSVVLIGAGAMVVGPAIISAQTISSMGIIFGATVGDSILTSITKKIVDAVDDKFESRPDEDEDPDEDQDDDKDVAIKMQSLKCIINGDLSESAIDVTKDGISSIKNDSYQDVACYVLSKIQDPTIYIEVNCKKNDSPLDQFRLMGTETSGNDFGNLESVPFTIKAGETLQIEIKLPISKLKGDGNSVKKSVSSFYWEVIGVGDGKKIFQRNTELSFYTLFDVPLTPWTNSGKGCSLPWVTMLDMAAEWINKKANQKLNADSLLERLTEGLFHSGAKLNVETGLPMYITYSTLPNDYLNFNLYYLAEAYKNQKMKEMIMSNMECTLLLCSLSRLHGVTLNMATLAESFSQGFSINEVKPMGYDKWMKLFPLPNGGDGFLSYQTFSVTDGIGLRWYELTVYDASLMLKDALFQGQLPVKLKLASLASALETGIIDAGTYRGMLVKNGQITTVSMPVIDRWYISTLKKED